jgi:hypothetical protein
MGVKKKYKKTKYFITPTLGDGVERYYMGYDTGGSHAG